MFENDEDSEILLSEGESGGLTSVFADADAEYEASGGDEGAWEDGEDLEDAEADSEDAGEAPTQDTPVNPSNSPAEAPDAPEWMNDPRYLEVARKAQKADAFGDFIAQLEADGFGSAAEIQAAFQEMARAEQEQKQKAADEAHLARLDAQLSEQVEAFNLTEELKKQFLENERMVLEAKREREAARAALEQTRAIQEVQLRKTAIDSVRKTVFQAQDLDLDPEFEEILMGYAPDDITEVAARHAKAVKREVDKAVAKYATAKAKVQSRPAPEGGNREKPGQAAQDPTLANPNYVPSWKEALQEGRPKRKGSA